MFLNFYLYIRNHGHIKYGYKIIILVFLSFPQKDESSKLNRSLLTLECDFTHHVVYFVTPDYFFDIR